MRVAAAPDKRELEAREDFAAGRYQEALEVFAKLYAEKLHPVYLRNIGRCYQNLAQPDRAISSFREYLRKMKHISADERAEIEGYIHEMEDLAKKQAADANAAGKTEGKAATDAKAPVEPLTPGGDHAANNESTGRVPPPPPPGSASTSLVVAQTGPTEGMPATADQPLYTRWWFWGVVGVVVVGAAVGTAAALGAFGKKDASCDGLGLDQCSR
jgi:tetratricopeptide (TPR) repeat protein